MNLIGAIKRLGLRFCIQTGSQIKPQMSGAFFFLIQVPGSIVHLQNECNSPNLAHVVCSDHAVLASVGVNGALWTISCHFDY